MDRLDQIEGAQERVDVFGDSPAFHDARILWTRLAHEDAFGPTLETQVRLLGITDGDGPDRVHFPRNDVLVPLRFHEVVAVVCRYPG